MQSKFYAKFIHECNANAMQMQCKCNANVYANVYANFIPKSKLFFVLWRTQLV